MKEKNKCDICGEESDFQFNITEKAAFFACGKDAKTLSDIIYPIGDKLAAFILKRIFKSISR